MKKEVKRQEAIVKGLVHYYTGRPCVRGHLSKRYTSNSHCVQCVFEDIANVRKTIIKFKKKAKENK